MNKFLVYKKSQISASRDFGFYFVLTGFRVFVMKS